MKLSTLKAMIKNGSETLEERIPSLLNFYKGLVDQYGGQMDPSKFAQWISEELDVSLKEANNALNSYLRQKMESHRQELSQKRHEKLQSKVDKAKEDIEKIKSQTVDLPALKEVQKDTTKSSYKIRIIKASKLRIAFLKRSSFDSILHAPFVEKAAILRKYISGFPTAKDAAKALFDEAKQLKDLLNSQSGPARMAKQAGKIDSFFGNLTGILSVLACLATYGAAGTSDVIARYGEKAAGTSEAQGWIVAILAWGVVGITTFLYKILKSLPNNE